MAEITGFEAQLRRGQALCLLRALLYILWVLPCAARADRPELRGFWADGFNEGYKTPQQVDILLRRLQEAHCNAVFAQMRKGGDAYYASHYEPWAHDDTAHFDALAYLIRRAHALNPPIAVHAWLNVCAVGANRYGLPGHIATLHPEWLSRNARLVAADPEVAKIDLGDPDAADWTFRIFMDVARHYDVDGIHLDFVRYSGKRRGYNAVNLDRFARRTAGAPIHRLPGSGLPDPDDPAWKQWRRDQVTGWVRKLYAHVVTLNPHIIVSGALIAWEDGPHNLDEWNRKSAAMNLVFQDWRGWLQEGILDLGCPMTYFRAASAHGLRDQRDWSDWIRGHQYGRAAAVAVGNWQNTIPDTLQLLAIARRPDAAGRRPYGAMLYSYAGTNESAADARGRHHALQLRPEFYAVLGQPSPYAVVPPFPADTPLPAMPWKARPTRGCLKGFVLNSDLQPVDGALVEARDAHGHVYRQRADGTGCYAFVDLPADDDGNRSLSPTDRSKSGTTGEEKGLAQTEFHFPDVVWSGMSPPKNGGIRGGYTVRVAGPDGQPAGRPVSIQAGHTTTEVFVLGGNTAPPPLALASLSAQMTSGARSTPGVGGRSQVAPLLLTLGTDTYPGNCYALDASGQGIRLRLAGPPLLPLQPGDVVLASGVPRIVEGEPTLDEAVVHLIDIVPMDALPAPVSLLTRSLADGDISVGRVARVRGTVIASSPAGFVLEDHGTRIEAPLGSRKEFGIESDTLDLSPPPVGAMALVTGVVARVGHITRLLPRGGSDVVLISTPPAARTARSWWLPLLIAIGLAATVGWRILRRRRA